MDFQIKLFSWPDKGDHLIMIARGLLDRAALEQVFHEVTTVTQPLQDCKVAMVSPQDSEQYGQLLMLTRDLAKVDFKVAVFTDSKSAVNWLTEIM